MTTLEAIVEELRTLPPPKLQEAASFIHRLAVAPMPPATPEALQIFRQLQREAGLTSETAGAWKDSVAAARR
jgi:hypothetical protein